MRSAPAGLLSILASWIFECLLWICCFLSSRFNSTFLFGSSYGLLRIVLPLSKGSPSLLSSDGILWLSSFRGRKQTILDFSEHLISTALIKERCQPLKNRHLIRLDVNKYVHLNIHYMCISFLLRIRKLMRCMEEFGSSTRKWWLCTRSWLWGRFATVWRHL